MQYFIYQSIFCFVYKYEQRKLYRKPSITFNVPSFKNIIIRTEILTNSLR